MLLHLVGKDVKQIYKTLKIDDEGYNSVADKLNNYFKPKVNVAYERSKQSKNESMIYFDTRLRSPAETCNFLKMSEAAKNQFISSCC